MPESPGVTLPLYQIPICRAQRAELEKALVAAEETWLELSSEAEGAA